MTTASVTTRSSAAKDLHPALAAPVADQAPTPIFRTFAELIDVVESAVEMERDLSHAMSWDPAMTGFAEEAESCWQDCLRLASDVLAAAPASASDQPLQRMSMLLHFLIESTSADEALRFQHLLESNHELFTAEDPERQAALRIAARQVNTLADLALSAAAQDCLPG